MKTTTKKKRSISQLKKEADRVFSLWIRARDRACFTCGSTENAQAGHFISRAKNNTRYDPENVYRQCVGCNVFKNGNYPVYAMKLGGKMVKELNRRGQILKQFTRQELEGIIKNHEPNKDI